MDAQQVYARMVRFVHSVSQAGASELRRFDLTPAQYQMLVSLDRTPGAAQWQLVEEFGVTKGNVSQLVKKLESSGFIQRSRVGGSTELALTAEGRELVQRIVPAHDEFMARQFAPLSAEELRNLKLLLRRLR